MKRIVIAMMAAAALVGCGKKPESPAPATTVPAAFVSAKPAGEPTPIAKAREMKPGTEIVLSGQVMGVKEPFVKGLGVFIIGDPELIAVCTDHCPTPWDACCDPIDVRVKATATIQLLGDNGAVLAQDIEGVGGLNKLSMVTVAGKVAQNSSAAAFVVNADAVYVEPAKK